VWGGSKGWRHCPGYNRRRNLRLLGKKRPGHLSSPAAFHPKKLVHRVSAEAGMESYKNFLYRVPKRGEGSGTFT
jgi:hypothetical protein